MSRLKRADATTHLVSTSAFASRVAARGTCQQTARQRHMQNVSFHQCSCKSWSKTLASHGPKLLHGPTYFFYIQQYSFKGHLYQKIVHVSTEKSIQKVDKLGRDPTYVCAGFYTCKPFEYEEQCRALPKNMLYGAHHPYRHVAPFFCFFPLRNMKSLTSSEGYTLFPTLR